MVCRFPTLRSLTNPLSIRLLGCLTLGLFTVAVAAQPAPYQMLTTIQIPGGLAANDISWVDSANGRFYLADRGNATATPPVAPRIDVIDTEHAQFVTAVTLPAPGNGVVAIPRAHEIWIGDNNSNVQVVDSNTFAITHTISTGGTARADEVAYDGVHHLILIANDRDTPPFVSFISTTTYAVVKKSTTMERRATRNPRAESSSLFGTGLPANSTSRSLQPRPTPRARLTSSTR